jgi:hypothetical protein
VEGSGEGIPHHLKDVAVMRLNGSVQHFMMPRKQGEHFIRILLCQFRAAFNIGKKKSHCACRDRYSASRVSDSL